MGKWKWDIQADRQIGKYWEREFCKMAAGHDFLFSPMQIGRNEAVMAYEKNGTAWKRLLLPDVTIWTSPGQHHEIKHKNPTRRGTFGLEVYRFHSLLHFAKETNQDVLYTIHNHDLSGGRDSRINDIGHWITTDVLSLNKTWVFSCELPSWVNGIKEADVLQYFWPINFWVPLSAYWG